jgi:AraC family transcriptional regulator
MYVRAHLDERLTLETLASVAGFSPFHFHRIFRVAFGENLNAYVVRQRLGRAARELRSGERSITEIGLQCGYESPSAFGRAFARAFGMTPSAFRRAGSERGGMSPVALSPAIEIGEPRIVEMSARAAFARRYVGPYDRVDAVVLGVREVALRRGFLPDASLFGLSYDSPDSQDHAALRFEACVTRVPGADVAGARADGLHAVDLPGGKYAVYRHRGSYARITHVFDLLVAAWVLSGRIELRAAPFMCTYLRDPFQCPQTELESDLALPVY